MQGLEMIFGRRGASWHFDFALDVCATESKGPYAMAGAQ